MKQIKCIETLKITKYDNNEINIVTDHVVIEEPLEIRLAYGSTKNRKTESIYITMRTPGHDYYLALGFLFTENVIQSYSQIYKIASLNNQVILVELNPGVTFDLEANNRNFSSNSSCGICGKTSISSISNHRYKPSLTSRTLSKNIILSLRDKIKSEQSIFNITGGLHSASLFDFDGNLVTIKEDVGRHNALDKIVGFILENKITDTSKYFIMLSGRLGFELIHKTLKARIPILVAIGSPSSLSIKIARKNKLCLIGFVKENGFNVYSGVEKVNM